MIRFRVGLALVLLVVLMQDEVAFAETYPARPIKLIVPTGAGSPPDIRARWLADKLRVALGQPVVVDNKPGAAGILGTDAAARSAPDGYTLLMAHQGTLALNPHLYAHLPYDPLKDIVPVARLFVGAMLLAVPAASPVNSVGDLMRLAKATPGQLTFGSSGVGSPPHMAGELFRKMAHVDVTHVPYKNMPAAQLDLIGGRIDYTFDALVVQLPQVQAGKLKAVAVTSAKRLAVLPDVPTMDESGVPGYEFWSWIGVCAPAGTPRAIVLRLNTEIGRILLMPETRDWFAAQGSRVTVESPEEFGAFIKAEHARWGVVIREAGIKGEELH